MWDFITNILAPFFSLLAAVGVGYIGYRQSRPESMAKAREINITGELKLSEGYKEYAEMMEKRFQEMDRRYAKLLEHVEKKDEEIKTLKGRVKELEAELQEYKKKGHFKP